MTSPSKTALLLVFALASLGSASAAHANIMTGTIVPAPVAGANALPGTPTIVMGSAALTSVLPAGNAVAFEHADPRVSGNAVLPEPATIAVLGIGLLGLGFLRRTRTR